MRKKGGTKLVDPPKALFNLSPKGDGVVLFKQIQKPLSLSRFEVRVDTTFEQVLLACADPRRTGRWITPQIVEAYVRMHEAGWAHSIETWQDGRLMLAEPPRLEP